MKSTRALLLLGVINALLLTLTGPGLAAPSLIPTKPGKAPDYFCTWNIQGYVASYASSEAQRNALTESNIFGTGLHQNWIGFYPRIRGDLYFVMDDSWDVGFSNYVYGTDKLSPARFPGFTATGTEPMKLKRLNDAVQAAGWRAVGGWICANQSAPETLSDQEFYTERLLWMKTAGWGYWKVDWGRHAEDAGWRRSLTDWAHAYAPDLTVEHALNWNCVPFADAFRTYDVEAITSIPVTLSRVCQGIRQNAKPPARGIINCEDEPSIGAALGCALGIMRHPFDGKLPDGRQDFVFPPLNRDLKQCLNEVERGVLWHRVAPPFRVDGRVMVDTNQLADTWCFQAAEGWAHTTANTWATNSAPARITRGGLPLPGVRVTAGEPPFVIASRNPNGAVTIATLGRTLSASPTVRHYLIPPADITLEVGAVSGPIGIFGNYASLTLKFDRPMSGCSILGQDILATEAADITSLVHIQDNAITIPGALIQRIGLAAATSGDKSDPGMAISIIAPAPVRKE